MSKKYPSHPAAEIFPIEEETLSALAADIKKNGQHCPIELCDGQVIDGRRRLLACRQARIEPEFVEIKTDDPVAYVLSLNLHRRHLTPSQKSMVAARARGMYDEAAKERQKRKPADSVVENLPPQKARDAAGKALGVSGKSVDFASRVLKQGTPELVKAVDEGRMAVSTAAVYASEPEEVQRVAANSSRRVYRTTAAELIKEKPITLPEGKSRGRGVHLAHEAIACLKRIPKNDALRSRGFQIVSDWIKHNRR